MYEEIRPRLRRESGQLEAEGFMKNRVEVVIAGNRFTMTGEQDEEYMTKIAALVDNCVSKIRGNGINMTQAITLAACDMADNYVQAVQGAENLRNQISGYLAENKSLSMELSDAHEEIGRLEKKAADSVKEMAEVNQFKDRIAQLEAQVEAAEQHKARIAELEEQVEAAEQHKVRVAELEERMSDAQKRIQSVQGEADARTRRVSELEQRLTEADTRHANDLEAAERTGRELRELRERVADNDKMQRRIEELEKELASTERQLNDLRSRLSRLLK